MVIEAKTMFHPQLVSPVLAEAMAVEEALSWMDNQGWHEASVESDCYAVVKAARSQVPVRSYLGLITEECRATLQRLNNIRLLFVKLYANMVTHLLARKSYYLSGRILDRNSIPSFIHDCISSDLNLL